MQAYQPNTAPTSAHLPGITRGGNQILFIQFWPDMLLGRKLKITKFQFNTLTSNQQIGLHLLQAPLQFRIELVDNRLARFPFANIFPQRGFHTNRFTLACHIHFTCINPLAAFPQYAAKFTKAFK